LLHESKRLTEYIERAEWWSVRL